MLFRLTAALACVATLCSAQNYAPPLEHFGLAPRILALESAGPESQLELAFLKSLRALEKVAQEQSKQGLGNSLANNPFLRFTPRNRFGFLSPEPRPDAVRLIAQTLISDLNEVRAAIDGIENRGSAEFILTVEDLWFDLDQNGERDEFETVQSAMRPLLGRGIIRRAERQAKSNETPLVIRFDEADIYWLEAYTHMLSTAAHAVLAFDPTEVIKDLEKGHKVLKNAPQIAPYLAISDVKAKINAVKQNQRDLSSKAEDLNKKLDPLRSKRDEIRKELRQLAQGSERDLLRAEQAGLDDEIRALQQKSADLRTAQRLGSRQLQSLAAKLPGGEGGNPQSLHANYSSLADSIFLLLETLKQQPDMTHLEAARDHWSMMITANRKFWSHVSQERDNDREWVPNPEQVSAIGLTIPRETAQTWQIILKEADALLQGQLLLPHPLLPDGLGISLAAYFEDPVPLDLLGWLHGRSAYPFVRRGQRISANDWRQFRQLTNGNAALFAIFLN